MCPHGVRKRKVVHCSCAHASNRCQIKNTHLIIIKSIVIVLELRDRLAKLFVNAACIVLLFEWISINFSGLNNNFSSVKLRGADFLSFFSRSSIFRNVYNKVNFFMFRFSHQINYNRLTFRLRIRDPGGLRPFIDILGLLARSSIRRRKS
jgi:hypothetical protein